MSDMEITFSRTVHYSFTLDSKDRRSLAEHIGISPQKLKKLANEGELLDEHWDEVESWLNSQSREPDLIDQDGIDDIEVHV